LKNSISLLLWLAASFSAGWFGSQFKPGEWYASLQKPNWTPPPLAFPIAWTILYALMGVSAWLVWGKRGEDSLVRPALLFFLVQIVLNALWSWIFFGQHEMGWAFVEISGLWLAVAVTLVFFWRINPTAGILLIPYLLWISFAAVLNGAIWKNN
jgi:translocator protein